MEYLTVTRSSILCRPASMLTKLLAFSPTKRYSTGPMITVQRWLYLSVRGASSSMVPVLQSQSSMLVGMTTLAIEHELPCTVQLWSYWAIGFYPVLQARISLNTLSTDFKHVVFCHLIFVLMFCTNLNRFRFVVKIGGSTIWRQFVIG